MFIKTILSSTLSVVSDTKLDIIVYSFKRSKMKIFSIFSNYPGKAKKKLRKIIFSFYPKSQKERNSYE